MGNILLEMNKPDEAKAKFDKALDIMEASNLAEEVKDNNRRFHIFNSARVALKKADLGTAKVKRAEFATAVTAVNAPLQIKLSHQLAGMIALAEKDYDKALEELLQSSTDFNSQNFYRIALAYQGLGNVEKAKEYFGKAANFNGLDGFNNAFCRTKAQEELVKLKGITFSEE